MGFVVALLVLGAWCGSCSAQRQRACVEAGKSDVCICSSATDSSPETVDCSSKTLADVPTGIPTSTEKLQLHINQLTGIPGKAFHGLTRLTYLELSNNKLQSLPVGVFDKLENLQDLHLLNNQLKSLRPRVFDSLSKLTWLSLDANQLQSVPHGAFDRLGKLQTILLLNNPWDCACSDIIYLRTFIAKKHGQNLRHRKCPVQTERQRPSKMLIQNSLRMCLANTKFQLPK
uniref:Variable lymphocyte receptor C n=1 Tax=Petromyzon marinus TaxID=7757 RepID=A0A088S9X2_PETMA|nr:variable lymphocyte receptor C [Petromyzon marinus]